MKQHQQQKLEQYVGTMSNVVMDKSGIHKVILLQFFQAGESWLSATVRNTRRKCSCRRPQPCARSKVPLRVSSPSFLLGVRAAATSTQKKLEVGCQLHK